jgi:hypothetical protein
VRVLPSTLAATMTRIQRRAGGDIQRLIRPGPSDVLNPPRFARELGRWRRELMRLPEHLGIATPILPGPGDSEQLGRRLSWVERLLLRF